MQANLHRPIKQSRLDFLSPSNGKRSANGQGKKFFGVNHTLQKECRFLRRQIISKNTHIITFSSSSSFRKEGGAIGKTDLRLTDLLERD